MKIKTKYDVGDSVWFMFNNKPISREINGISVEYGGGLMKVLYEVYINDSSIHLYGSDIFETKEDLLKTL